MATFIKNIIKAGLCSFVITVSVAQTAQAQSPSTTPTMWEEKNCILENINNNTTLKTDAYLSNNHLRISLTLKNEVRKLPTIIFNAKRNMPIFLEGTSPHYAFELPYAAHETADLLHKNSVIIIGYQAKGTDIEYYETFDTASLVPLVSYVAKNCLKQTKLLNAISTVRSK